MVKKIILITLVIIISLSFINIVNASEFSTVTDEATDWVEKGKNLFETLGVATSDITSPIVPIAQALTTIGVGILLCVAAVMGIKWITANPEEQAKLKQQSVGLLVSAVVILGAYTIWSIALKIVSQF